MSPVSSLDDSYSIITYLILSRIIGRLTKHIRLKLYCNVHILLYIINYNIRTWKTFRFLATTSYDYRKVKRQFSTLTSEFSISGWPDVRWRRIKRSLRGRRLHPHMCDHMFILDITAEKNCWEAMCDANEPRSRRYIYYYLYFIHTYTYIILIQTGVCVALKDIGRRHPLVSLENSSKRCEYTQIVCVSPSHLLSFSLFLHLSFYLSHYHYICLRLS